MAVYRPPHLRTKVGLDQTSPSFAHPRLKPLIEANKPTLEPVYGQTEDAHTSAVAVAEKRRLYVGNMPYFAKELDVRNLFQGRPVEHVAIAIDPFTGRNPSYCFVDLTTTGDAERAIADLNEKDLLGRPVRVKHGTPHRLQKGALSSPPQAERLPGRGRVWDKWQNGESKAASHFMYTPTGARVFVGNLPSFNLDPAWVDAEIKTFFKGFQIIAVSKIIRPRSGDANALPHHSIGHYAFVDFVSTDEANRAVKTLNGQRRWGRALKVALPTQTHSWKIEERKRYLANQDTSIGLDDRI